MSAAIRGQSETLARLETLDCGKPIRETRADMEASAAVFDYYADAAPRLLADEPLPATDKAFTSRVVCAPAGVVGAITPWNYPLMQACVKVAPALATGCSVLLKPSPLASLTCLELGKMAVGAGVPEGALSVLTGGPPVGVADGAARLASHPALDFLSFTGSSGAGRTLLHASAEQLRRTSLELGGKGAILVFEDADLDAAVDWAMVGIFMASGQVSGDEWSSNIPARGAATSRADDHQGAPINASSL